MQPNTALQYSLRQSSNHCRITVSRKTRQGAAPRHTTTHWEPNRRPYTTIRPFFTQQQTIVPALVPSITNHRSQSLRHNRECAKSNRTGNPREKVQHWSFTQQQAAPHKRFPHSSFTLGQGTPFLRERSSLNPGAKHMNAQSHKSLARSTRSETS